MTDAEANLSCTGPHQLHSFKTYWKMACICIPSSGTTSAVATPSSGQKGNLSGCTQGAFNWRAIKLLIRSMERLHVSHRPS
jgi:hypothetical protein